MSTSRQVLIMARKLFESLVPSIRTHLPVVITGYDGSTNTAKVQPVNKTMRVEDPDNMTSVDGPELEDVPVIQFGSGKLMLTCAPQADSYGVVHVSDREIETFLANGGINSINSLRTHDISDALLSSGVYTLKEDGDNGLIMEPIKTDRISMRTRSGLTEISVLDDESIEINVNDGKANLVVDLDGNVTLTADGACDITSGGTCTINGNFTVDP